MAIQSIKKGQLLTVPATEDELILLPPYNVFGQVRFINISGTSKFVVGGPIQSTDPGVTTAGSVVGPLTIDMLSQTDSVNRIHCSGAGTWRVEY